ncbi:hypothetical protein KJ632_01085, partial [Patescibacteria group bacterium]|nr:hypothetical protein [Patescibacteria group bacterium]
EFIYIFRGKKRRKGGKRVEIEVIIPKTYENNNEKVFEKMSDPTVGYIQYVGHAGGRNQLSNAIEDARKKYGNKIISQPKIFVGQACWSFKNYAPSIKRIFPYSHYIGTKEISNVVEGQNLFEDILNGVLEEKSWAEIYKKMKKRPHPFEKTKDGKVKNWKIEEYTKGLVASNYVMPDSIENLQTLDSDGDGIPDSRDRQYNLIASTVNYEESCNPSMPGAIEQPQQSLNDQINYVNQYLEKLFKYTSSDVVPFVSVDLYEDSNPAYDIYGWYEGSDDAKQNLVKINSTYVENIEDLRTDSYKEQLQLKISFNHRYMKASPKALTMMAMKEIYEYLYKNIDLEKMNEENEKADGNKDKIIYKDQKELNTEDKEKIFYLSMVDIMRGFHMPQNKDKKDVYENLFLTFKEKYKIPEELTFDMAFQFVWSKKYAGNKETWHEDPDLSPLYQKYQEYNEKIKHPDEMKEDPHFTKYEELKKEKKDNDTIAQILACEELIQKINSLL